MPQPLSNALVGVPAKCRTYFVGGDSSQVKLLEPLAEMRTHLMPVFRPYLHCDWQLRRVGILLLLCWRFDFRRYGIALVGDEMMWSGSRDEFG